MDTRSLEKSAKLGFLFYISYEGKKFHSFDENSDKKSVKGEFIRIANELGFTWAKGVQQGGRTDAGWGKHSVGRTCVFCDKNIARWGDSS